MIRFSTDLKYIHVTCEALLIVWYKKVQEGIHKLRKQYFANFDPPPPSECKYSKTSILEYFSCENLCYK